MATSRAAASAVHLAVEVVDLVVAVEQFFEAVALFGINVELLLDVGPADQEFVDGVETVHLGQSEIGVEVAAVGGGLENAVHRVLDQPAVVGLGALQLFSSRLEFGDVSRKTEGAHHLSVRGSQWHFAREGPSDPAAGQAFLLESRKDGLAGPQDREFVRAGGVGVLTLEEIVIGLPDQVTRVRHPDSIGEGLAGTGDPRIAVLEINGVGRVFE